MPGAMAMVCIQELPGTNLYLITDYIDQVFVSFIKWAITIPLQCLKIYHDGLLPNPYYSSLIFNSRY